MNSLITTFGIIFTIFGIIIPLIMTALAIKNKNELKQIKDNVDDFITTKFQEWEKQSIDDALERYLNNELDWAAYHTILKRKFMPFEHMKKIFDVAMREGNNSPHNFYKRLECLAYHVFYEQKNNKTTDFKKIRDVIITSKYFYTFAIVPSIPYFANLKTFTTEQQVENIKNLINFSDISLSRLIEELNKNDLMQSLDKKMLVQKIIEKKDAEVIRILQNDEMIINEMYEKLPPKSFRYFPALNDKMQIMLWSKLIMINDSSYLSTKIKSDINSLMFS